ncbi:MAG: NAD(P)-dependent oxidoreductase [Candidatus Saelkia tenebricola]|nr:NAD(P)-dependent oxidoreductase [Candidatus Saelkia tenebricola]
MKILVTGAAGYIGAILVPALLKESHCIIAVDNFMYNQTPLLDCCNNKNLEIIRGDARDKSLIAKLIKEVDVILPLACLTGSPLCKKDPTTARSVVLDAIKMINDLRSKEQIIIFPTTNSGYGIGEKDKYCTEEALLKPISLYGKLKVEAENVILNSPNSITLRLATVFGISPRMRLDLLVNDFTYRALNDKYIVLFEAGFKRNYIHVRDVAKVFLHCLNNFEQMKNEPYNVGLSDANLSKMELAEKIKNQIPELFLVESDISEDPDKRDYVISNEKIEKTGFKPQISLEEGIAELIKGYQVIKNNKFSNV